MADPVHHLAFGGARIALAASRPLGWLSPGLFVTGNLHGLMAAGFAGEVRVRAGRDIEVELLGHRPLSLGRAYPTGAGGLAETGVQTIVHGIVSAEPGEAADPGHTDRALRSALVLLDELGIRRVTLPLVEVVLSRDRAAQGRAMGTLIAGHMRRRSRLLSVTVAGLDEDFLAGVRAALLEAGAHAGDDSTESP